MWRLPAWLACAHCHDRPCIQTLTVISFELEYSTACREQGPELSALAKGPFATKRRASFYSLVCSNRAAAKLAHGLSVTRVPAFVVFQAGVPLATLVGEAADVSSLTAALERAVSNDAARAWAAQERERTTAAASAAKLLAGNKFAEAVVQFTRALDAGTCGNRMRAELSLGRARASFKAAATSAEADDDFRAAERDANMVIALVPDDALAMYALELRARVRQATGKLDAAEADCREIIDSKVRRFTAATVLRDATHARGVLQHKRHAMPMSVGAIQTCRGPCSFPSHSRVNLQVADAKTIQATNELLLLLCPPAPAPAPVVGSLWKAASKVVTTAAAVAAAAAPAALEAKQPTPKSPEDAPPPDTSDAAAAAAKLEQQRADEQELEKAHAFWESWSEAKGKPEPKYWTAEQVWLWCVPRCSRA
jgi:hypothetical protein